MSKKKTKKRTKKKQRGTSAALLGLICTALLVCSISYFGVDRETALNLGNLLEQELGIEISMPEWNTAEPVKLPELELPELELPGLEILKGLASGSSGSGEDTIGLDDIPDYEGSPYVELNGNVPDLSAGSVSENEKTPGYEKYSNLDRLGRCGVTFACVGTETMPTEERGSIGMIKPSGWHTVRYDDLIEDKYLYNRCHLIGFQLTGENANEKNLITGTRYFNVKGMLPFENQVADYVETTGNHVLYRVTPVFEGSELVARGVQMEAYSLEDRGKGVCFNVYVYNVQPGIEIDYATGESWRAE